MITVRGSAWSAEDYEMFADILASGKSEICTAECPCDECDRRNMCGDVLRAIEYCYNMSMRKE